MKRVLFGFLVLGVLIVLFFSFGGFRWIQSYLKIPIQITKEIEYINKRPPFHPRAVLGIKWKTLFAEQEYHRANALAPWEPAVKPKFIFQVLNELPLLKYQEVISHAQPKVHLSFVFSNGVEWELAWDGRVAWWTSGNLKDQGVELVNSEMNFLFLTGALAFENPSWTWCQKPISKLEILSGGEIQKSIEGYDLQIWLGKNCKILVDSYLDDQMFKVDFVSDRKVKVSYQDGDQDFLDANSQNAVFWWPQMQPPYTMFRSKDLAEAIFSQEEAPNHSTQ